MTPEDELAYLRERWWAVRGLLLHWDQEAEAMRRILSIVRNQPRVDAIALAHMLMIDELRVVVESTPAWVVERYAAGEQ